MSPTPNSREEILQQIDSAKARVYELVREILDTFELVAPWDVFYEAPSDDEEMLRIHQRLVEVIEEIPQRGAFRHLEQALSRLIRELPLSAMDQVTKEIFIRLLDRHSDEAHTPRARAVAKETLDHLPDDQVEPSIRELLKFFIDRNSGIPISDEVLAEAIDSLPESLLPESEKKITTDLQFYFRSIHEQIETDLAKIKPKLNDLAETAELFGTTSPEQQKKLYTLGADLKGKCVSSLMGAAAGLIAEGRWSGPSIEPLLFPEKSAEAQRNENLAITLEELVEHLRDLPEKTSLGQHITKWKARARADRYAMTPFYNFLSALGEVLKAENRRAIYLSDYYVLQECERSLAGLVNELNRLSQLSWENEVPKSTYREMVRKALELATTLDETFLSQLIGENNVVNLKKVVALRKRRLEKDGSAIAADQLLEKVPERLRSLVPILHQDDLFTVLSALKNVVLKRATFTFLPPDIPPPAPQIETQPQVEAQPAVEIPAEPIVVEPAVPEMVPSEVDAPEVDALEIADLDITGLDAAALEGIELEAPVEEIPELDLDLEILPVVQSEPTPEPPQTLPEPTLESPTLEPLTLEPTVVPVLQSDPEGATSIPEILAEGPPLGEDFDLLAATEDLDLTMGSQMILAAVEESDRLAPDASFDVNLEKRESLELLRQLLEESLSTTNSGRKAFLLVHRMLSQKRMVPLPMLRSIAPYLDDLMNLLVPQIMMVSQFCDMPPAFENLTRYCQEVLHSAPNTPEQIEQVGTDMDRIDRLLNGLQSLTRELLAELPDA